MHWVVLLSILTMKNQVLQNQTQQLTELRAHKVLVKLRNLYSLWSPSLSACVLKRSFLCNSAFYTFLCNSAFTFTEKSTHGHRTRTQSISACTSALLWVFSIFCCFNFKILNSFQVYTPMHSVFACSQVQFRRTLTPANLEE